MNINLKLETATVALAAVIIVALLAVGVFAQGAMFQFYGPLSRIITPNGDQLNDMIFLCFDNPADSEVTGKIYSRLGSEVSGLGPRQTVSAGNVPHCPPPSTSAPMQYMTWDGRSNGRIVGSGIYVYRVSVEQKVYSGTLVLVK